MKILAVVVTYNSEAVIEACLVSVRSALGSRGDIIVVDNGSSDGTVESVLRYPGVRVVRSANDGYAAGINKGAAMLGQHDYILVLNPDTELARDAVDRMLLPMEAHTVGIVVPKILDSDGALFHSLRREPTIPRSLGLSRTRMPFFSEALNRDSDYRRAQVVDWATGAVMLVRRACFAEIGGWDESFFLYSEETDFCLRARDSGWNTRYEPEAVVMHVGGGSGRNPRTYAMQILNRTRLYGRRHGPAATIVFFLLSVLRESLLGMWGDEESSAAARALLMPNERPMELRLAATYLPS